MLEDFILRGILGGIGLAIVAAPLGCFLVWRKMAYFGDTLAHSSLVGVTMALFLNLNITIAVIFIGFVLALLIVYLQSGKNFADDTLLGIISHSMLALGIVCISLLPNNNIDIMGYLFGDILAVSKVDLTLIYLGGSMVSILLLCFWNKFLTITVDAELAHVDGINVKLFKVLLMLLIAFVIAIAMKIVGILLITSLLIIPAATARSIAKSPEQMAIFAIALGIAAVILGMSASLTFDVATGAAIVLTQTVFFLSSLLLKRTLG